MSYLEKAKQIEAKRENRVHQAEAWRESHPTLASQSSEDEVFGEDEEPTFETIYLPVESNPPWVLEDWSFSVAHNGIIASHLKSDFEAWWPFRTNPDLTPPGDTQENFERRLLDKAREARRPSEKPLGTKRQAKRDKTLGSSEVDGWEVI